jgi:hypothetical protein
VPRVLPIQKQSNGGDELRRMVGEREFSLYRGHPFFIVQKNRVFDDKKYDMV